jgi:GNAT superfamily N-acetyltransferase
MDTKEWQRTVDSQTYLISTSRDLLPHDFVQQAFGTPAMYWAKPTTAINMKTLLDNSCTLGLYKIDDSAKQRHTPIGMARFITDYITMAYLTDVYVVDEYRKRGLAKWMIQCCREIAQEIPDLRFMLLLTGSEHAEQMYRRELGMEVLERHTGGGLAAMGARKEHLSKAWSAEAGQEQAPTAHDSG